jgi:hypothetical protein
MRPATLAATLLIALAAPFALAADGMDPKVQTAVEAATKDAQSWAADPAIVDAVKAANASPSEEAKSMTQEKWKSLTLTDPFVRAFSKNPAATFLKSKKSEVISEAFLSAADGTKVAFLAKTSNWSHKGKAKHDDPMAGKVWQGAIEVDESSGIQQMQIAVPVKDGDKVIGALTIGINISKVKQ